MYSCIWFCSNVHFNVQITELKACSTGKQLKGSDLGTERERGRERAAIVVGDHTRTHTRFAIDIATATAVLLRNSSPRMYNQNVTHWRTPHYCQRQHIYGYPWLRV